MSRSLLRSFSVRKPSASRLPRSPVHSHRHAGGGARPGCASSRPSPSRRAPAPLRPRPPEARRRRRRRRARTGVCATPTDARRSLWRGCRSSRKCRRERRRDHRRLALAVDLHEARAHHAQRAQGVGEVHRRPAVDDGLGTTPPRRPGSARRLGVLDEAADDGRRGEGRQRAERAAEREQLRPDRPRPRPVRRDAHRPSGAGSRTGRSRATSARRTPSRRRCRSDRRRRSRPGPSSPGCAA